MNRLFVTALKSVGLVGAGDDPEATVTFWKSADLEKREFSQEQREQLAREGKAMPDGSFPIVTTADLQNAINAFGRASNNQAAKRHIIKRARALNAVEMLPDAWNVSKMVPSGETAPDDRSHNVDLSAIEDQDLRKSIEDALAEKDTQVSELTEKVEELTPDPDPVEKADEDVKALITKEREEREKLEKQLAEERSARRTTEYIEKAKTFSDILGKPSDVGPVLADIAEKAPESFEKLDQWITAAAQQADLSELFKEKGAGEGDPERDPIAAQEQYVSKAKESGTEKSEAQLKAEFWQTSQGREMKKEMRS